jgi:hypothetical protein
MDVIRDGSIVALNRNQVRVLETNLQASRDRFEVGDLTRTDVAQSEARLALARSALEIAEGRLSSSEENYQRVIGDRPDNLQPPPPLPPLPGTADQAVQVALANNSDLVSIAAQVRAAERDVQIVRADRLPTVNAIGSGRATNFLGTADEQFGPNARNTQTSTGIGIQGRFRSIRVASSARACARRRPSSRSCSNRASPSSAPSSPRPAPPTPPTWPRWPPSDRTKRPSPPTPWRWKASAPNRPSAPATCSMFLTPFKNSSTAKSNSSPPAATLMWLVSTS